MRLAKATRTGSFLLPVLVLAAVLALAGCGGGDDSSSDSVTTGTGAAEAGDGPGAKQDEKGAKGQGKQSAGESEGGKQGPNAPQPKSEREPGITPKQRSKATTASVTLESPGFSSGVALPAKYTCDGANTSPPLRWSGVPEEAAELVLMVLNFQPVNEALFFDWAVAGLDPSLEKIAEGKLPADAIVGKNSFGKQGYGLCPPGAESENYIFMLYAIPEVLSPEEGFDPLKLREEVLAQSGNVGLLGTSYKRG